MAAGRNGARISDHPRRAVPVIANSSVASSSSSGSSSASYSAITRGAAGAGASAAAAAVAPDAATATATTGASTASSSASGRGRRCQRRVALFDASGRSGKTLPPPAEVIRQLAGEGSWTHQQHRRRRQTGTGRITSAAASGGSVAVGVQGTLQ